MAVLTNCQNPNQEALKRAPRHTLWRAVISACRVARGGARDEAPEPAMCVVGFCLRPPCACAPLTCCDPCRRTDGHLARPEATHGSAGARPGYGTEEEHAP